MTSNTSPPNEDVDLEIDASRFPSLARPSPPLTEDGRIDWGAALKINEAWMRSVIAQRVGEQGAVDEVFQEIALAVASESAPLRDPTKLNAWLYRLAVLQSALYRRKAGRKRKALKRYEELFTAEQSDVGRQEPIDWLLLAERRQLVRESLDQLSDDERQILLLKYSEDKSYREIATELGTTEHAVQSKLHRARRRLKQILSQRAKGDFDLGTI